MATQQQWIEIRRRHAASIEAFAEAASLIDRDKWEAPMADGKWSPGLVAEHLIGAYEAVLSELRGGKGIQIQTGWFLRNVLRQTVLRWIMNTRRLPRGARAPREAYPKKILGPKDERLAELSRLASEFESAVESRLDDSSLVLTHHFFGSVDAIKGTDFLAIHNEHHTRQLEEVRRG